MKTSNLLKINMGKVIYLTFNIKTKAKLLVNAQKNVSLRT